MKHRPHFAARSALALAACAALSSWPLDASALGLGRLSVQSALGEGMRAEIDITNLSPEEASSLSVRVASPDAYRAAGVEFNSVLSGTQVSVARRPDGRPFLRVSSDRAVQEPFLEVILELNWASGRLVREYTLLFDPPGSRMAPPVQAAVPVAPVISAAPAAPAAAPPAANVAQATPRPRSGALPAPAPSPAPAPVAPPPVAAKPPAPAAKPPAPPPAPAPAPVSAARAAPQRSASAEAPGEYTVQPGDTLSRIALQRMAGGVSLDQMLVGLYRANPDAFIKNNVNRLLSGAVLTLPPASAVAEIPKAEARRIIVAQSRDFGAYRSRLAQGAPEAETEAASRQAKGRVQAAVDDRKQSAAPTPDRLKLSGGSAKASSPEALVAQANERKAADARLAELSRNMDDLKKLQQSKTPAVDTAAATRPAGSLPPAPPLPSPAASVAAPAPLVPPVVPALAASVAEPASLPASAPVEPPPMMASAPAVAPPVVAPAPPPVADAEPATSFMDSLTNSPWLLPGAGILAVLLAGLGAWRLRNRLQKSPSETSFLESRMQPDSFFGASGGQRVDTGDGAASGASSMGYSLSQIDAIGDVDPVAEADVYLAYGRDLQAEEILKEAMRATPDRLAVRTKLLEVYAKRRDAKGFELLATQLYALTNGSGTDWERAQEMGRQVDADNQLYQPGGHPEEIILDGERVVVEPLSATTLPHELTRVPANLTAEELGGDSADLDDLNLDLDLSEDSASRGMEATQPMAPGAHLAPAVGSTHPFADTAPHASLDLPDLPDLPATPDRTVRADLDPMSFDLDGPEDEPPTVADRGARALDFGPATVSDQAKAESPTTPGGLDSGLGDDADPLARKLELAEEFRQIGDVEGARDLVSEVVAKSSGALQAKAQAMLDALG